jgi:hypothetical protein
MSPASRDDLRRLHFVNALFARLTGDDLYLAKQIQEAIAFSLAELAEQTRARPELAARYDAAFTASATPLFARAELMTGLKRLAPHRESTLLVTNLRAALLPPEQRETARRRREYEDALAYVQDLAAARTRPDADLRLLFL